MGDRTFCTLRLLTAPSPDLNELLDEHLGMPQQYEDMWFKYHEVNYGELPEDLEAYLIENKISFCWTWGNGGGYQSGLIINHNGSRLTFPTLESGGEIVLSVTEASDPSTLAQAQRFEAYRKLFL